MLRTALITWNYPPRPTGLGRAAAEIAAGLTEAGAEVTVITFDREGAAEEEGVRVIGCAIGENAALGWWRRRAALGHLAAPLAARRAAARHAPEGGFDVVETTNWYAPGAFVRRGRGALVVRNSTPAIEVARKGMDLGSRADLSFAHRLEAGMARRADALISNAPHHAAAIERWYGLEGHGAHHVVPLSLSAARIEEGAAAPPPFGSEDVTFLFVGRAEHRKGFRELIEGFAAFAKRSPATLLLAGLSPGEFARGTEGMELTPQLRAQIEDLGRVEDDELTAAFARADIVAAPSRYESYGLVYREAAAFGRPLIGCAEDPSASALLKQHPIGVLADTCSGEAIAQAMADLTADRQAARRMGEAGRDMAAGLSRRALGEATLEVYEEAMRRRAGRRAVPSAHR